MGSVIADHVLPRSAALHNRLMRNSVEQARDKYVAGKRGDNTSARSVKIHLAPAKSVEAFNVLVKAEHLNTCSFPRQEQEDASPKCDS